MYKYIVNTIKTQKDHYQTEQTVSYNVNFTFCHAYKLTKKSRFFRQIDWQLAVA